MAKAVGGVVRRALLLPLEAAMGEATGGRITGRESGAGVMGAQLMISFWAWGDAEREAMNALGRLMKHLARAVQDVGRTAAAT